MEALAILGVFLLLGLAFLYSAFSWGLVFMKFYTWFVLPVFTDLPPVNFWQSVGLMFFVALFCRYAGEGLKKEFKDSTSILAVHIISPWISLFVGWLVLKFFIV